MISNSKNPIRMLNGLVEHQHLIRTLIKRDIQERYRGSVLGMSWSLFHPVVMLLIYTFVFSFVFKARWNTGSSDTSEFALVLFPGMIAHSLLAENLSRAPSLVLSNVNYVKKIVFPLDILPLAAFGTTLFHSLISLLVWSTFYIFVHHSFQLTALYLPLILLPLAFYCIGFAWIFSALGVFIRDIGQVTSILSTVLLFLSPIFYPVSNVPERFQVFMYMNPLTLIVEQIRDVLIWGVEPNWYALALTTGASIMIAGIGFMVFQKTRPGFADVL